MEVSMKRVTILALAAALAVAGQQASARSDDDEALEKRLEEAQRRLEDAAREVAELSGEAAGHEGFRSFELFAPARRRAMLGVNLGAALPNGGGVGVAGVSPGGPAAEAGIKAGDVIVAIKSKPVTTGREIVRAMEEIEPGEKVELGLRRDGKAVEIEVEARPFDRVFMAGTALPPIPPGPAMRALAGAPFDWEGHWLLDDWGDAEFVTLTPGLGRYFGAEKGVLVARAPGDASLGLEDGDVIVAIGGREPQNSRHAMRILRSYQPGEGVEIRILRNRRAETLRASIPERKPRDVFFHRPAPAPKPATPPAPPAPPAPREEPAST
jgi:S1-C subfamily serine protease